MIRHEDENVFLTVWKNKDKAGKKGAWQFCYPTYALVNVEIFNHPAIRLLVLRESRNVW